MSFSLFRRNESKRTTTNLPELKDTASAAETPTSSPPPVQSRPAAGGAASTKLGVKPPEKLVRVLIFTMNQAIQGSLDLHHYRLTDFVTTYASMRSSFKVSDCIVGRLSNLQEPAAKTPTIYMNARNLVIAALHEDSRNPDPLTLVEKVPIAITVMLDQYIIQGTLHLPQGSTVQTFHLGSSPELDFTPLTEATVFLGTAKNPLCRSDLVLFRNSAVESYFFPEPSKEPEGNPKPE